MDILKNRDGGSSGGREAQGLAAVIEGFSTVGSLTVVPVWMSFLGWTLSPSLRNLMRRRLNSSTVPLVSSPNFNNSASIIPS